MFHQTSAYKLDQQTLSEVTHVFVHFYIKHNFKKSVFILLFAWYFTDGPIQGLQFSHILLQLNLTDYMQLVLPEGLDLLFFKWLGRLYT